MSKNAVWILRYVAGNPAMLTAVTTDAGGPMRRRQALLDGARLATANPAWRIWVEHTETGERIWASDAEIAWRREQVIKDIDQRRRETTLAAMTQRGGSSDTSLKARLQALSAPPEPDFFAAAAKKMAAPHHITLDALIGHLSELRRSVGGDAPVVVDARGGGIRSASANAARLAAGRGPLRLVSRQGVACVVIE